MIYGDYQMAHRTVKNAQNSRVSLTPLYMAAALFYLLLIPEQMNFRLGAALLPPYRVYLLAGFMFLFSQASKRGSFRFVWSDLAIILGCFWIVIASYLTSDSFGAALLQGGAHVTDIGLAYFFMRLAIRTPTELRWFLILVAPGVGLMGLTVFLESISGRHIIQPLFSAITGQPTRVGIDVRLGLTRGVASFPHPILAGISLASFLTLYWMSGIRGWPKFIGALGACAAFFTMSSAALLGLFAGLGSMVYDWLSKRVSNLSWRLFLAGIAALYLVVELVSDSGFFNLLVRYASLNTVSAYNRVLIWEFGSQSVINHPFFGIGYADWERPSWMNWSTSSSIDHFWLILAMRFGLPASLLLIFASAAAVISVAKRSKFLACSDAQLFRGVAISLTVFALGAVSVSLWLNALVWFFMLVGSAASLGTHGLSRPGQRGFVNTRPSLRAGHIEHSAVASDSERPPSQERPSSVRS